MRKLKNYKLIDLFDLYTRFCSRVNTFQGGFFRPQTDFERAVNDINMEVWNEYTNMAEKTQQIKDNLTPFLKSKNIAVKALAAYGSAPYPTEPKYARFSSARIIVAGDKCYPCKEVDNGVCIGVLDDDTKEQMKEDYLNNIEEYPVDNIDNSRWGAAISHITKKPTYQKAKMTQTDTGFKIAPRQISVLVLDYYIEPDYVKFAYDVADGDVQTGAGDQIIYNAQKSDKLLWNGTMINEFLIRLGIAFSVFTREQFLWQTQQEDKK